MTPDELNDRLSELISPPGRKPIYALTPAAMKQQARACVNEVGRLIAHCPRAQEDHLRDLHLVLERIADADEESSIAAHLLRTWLSKVYGAGGPAWQPHARNLWRTVLRFRIEHYPENAARDQRELEALGADDEAVA